MMSREQGFIPSVEGERIRRERVSRVLARTEAFFALRDAAIEALGAGSDLRGVVRTELDRLPPSEHEELAWIGRVVAEGAASARAVAEGLRAAGQGLAEDPDIAALLREGHGLVPAFRRLYPGASVPAALSALERFLRAYRPGTA